MTLKRTASDPAPTRLGRWLRVWGAGVAAAASAVTLVAGCLDRPVEPQNPSTSNVYVAEIRQTAVDKIDLLFMIDNSISMADKQAILRDAVPILLRRLVQPVCVDANGNQTDQNSTDGCSGGGEAEFNAIRDIHIGVVSSSLGAHGGQVCAAQNDPDDNDRGRMLGTVRPGLTSYTSPQGPTQGPTGFLAWDPDTMRPRNNPPGERNQMALETNFQDMVVAAGQTGCGYEASLEAWYRFLIDPDPPSEVGLILDANMRPSVTGANFNPPDQTVLAQRAAFLRPDSLVAIIMLTDENDCSIIDEGQGWLVGFQNLDNSPYHLPRSTSACIANPNSRCCVSCGAGSVPDGCPGIGGDAECAKGNYPGNEDNPNLRCFDQKRRFGFDLLYGINRYVEGLTQTTIFGRKLDGDGRPILQTNPLFAGTPPRDSSLVFLAGIVGVPWQDVATTDSLNSANLKYLTYKEMVDQDRWSLILGSPGDETVAPTLPRDALMVETSGDRTGLPQHPLLMVPVAPPTAAQNANPINGHESTIGDGSDLQFACTFPLTPPKMCTDANDSGCDCKASDAQYNRSLCTGTTQNRAKAYPGVRHLQVLKAFGERTGNSIVASICPKSLDNPGSATYGYNPAVAAIIDRLKEALRGKCLPRPLVTDEDTGTVPCVVVEAQAQPAAGGGCAPCDPSQGRADPSDTIRPAVFSQLAENGNCGKAPLPACESYCLCEIQQFQDQSLNRCKNEGTTPMDIFGYCYIDPATEMNPANQMSQNLIVASCPATQKRLLRFTGDNVPAKGAIAMIACLGASITEQQANAAQP